MNEAEKLLEDIKKAFAEGRRADALDLAYDRLDDWMLEGCFDPVRNVLKAVAQKPEDFPLSLHLSILTITRAWHAELKADRLRLHDSVRDLITRERGPHEAENLIRGLR